MKRTMLRRQLDRAARLPRALLGALCAATLLLVAGPALGAGACSPEIGRATLNEYNHLDKFVEVKRLDVAAAMTGWKVRVYSKPGVYAQREFPAASGNACGEYHVFDVSAAPKDADIVLLDDNDDVVDILRVRTASLPVSTAFYTPYPGCAFLSPPTDLQIDAARKGVDRTPDGVGPWRNTPGVGANSYETRCGGNAPTGAAADLQVTKTAGAASILLGASVRFTVTVTNLGPNIGSTLIVTDTLPAGLTYLSHTTSAGTYSAATGLWTLGSLAVGASQTLILTASGNSVGTWTNTATVASDNSDPLTANNTASAGVTVLNPAPASFNAFEPATPAGAITGVIRTKVAGSAFGLDVVAISGGAQDASFNGSVRVELLGNATTGVGLDARNCPVSATLLQTVPTAALSGGRATVGFAAVGDAWKDVRVRIGYPASAPTAFACSNDNFAIRPERFESVIVSDADSSTAGTARTLDNTAASGGIVHRAGRPFRIAARAVNASGASTANYADSPEAGLTGCLLPTGTCTPGLLATGTWSAAAGSVATMGASYSEAGAFAMTLVDRHFADVDAADSTPTERHVESAPVNVGRFVPDHFDLVAANTPVFKTFNDTACSTRSFTYVGQAFGYEMLPQATITAKNAGGGVTVNYAGALWKLAASGVTQTYTAVTGSLDTGLVGTPVVSETGSGSGTLTPDANGLIAFARSLPLSPFSADVNLSLSVRDSAENGEPGNGVIETATPAQFTDIAFDSGDEMRFGRLVARNAHGSELLPLPVAIETQHWTAAGFVRNAADFCTQLAASHVALSNWQRNLDLCETSAALSGRFNAGRGNLRFAAPGQGNSGSVDLVVRLDGLGGGSACVGGVTTPAVGAAQPWLRGQWSGAAYDQNPAARASFGLHRGSRAQIYMRELY